ncbi:ATPase, F1 complex, gamma subunit [Corchorus capsularis]|uniref:ATPase, F1 complex, gamma subunit n=1 Tax=Corchorus capsularis TaxID=210143 RepID=A0A1R3KY81_COCAP|nr:ATPase, F1 complex, gamma subunit [Corchorus capsularis]
MDCSSLPTWIASKPSNSNKNVLFNQFNQNPFLQLPLSRTLSRCLSRFAPIQSSLRQLRERIQTVKNTQKITEAMKLVAAAKVRRAQEAVINGVGFPTAKEAQMVADDVFSLFITEEVDKVELIYTKFVSLVKSDPIIRTLLPLSVKGEVVDGNGNCVDAMEDELFRLTTKEGKLIVERDRVRVEGGGISPLMQFEQDPVQILDAMMPLYLNSQILRALQESLASELAARMNAMSNATDNAVELKKNLSIVYNRERQAKITSEILEIVAGAEALT